MIGRYSMQNMLRSYGKHHHDTYTKDTKGCNCGCNDDVIDIDRNVLMLLIFMALALWVWALIAVVQFWNKLPDWAKIISLITLLTDSGGPIITLLVVYFSKSD